MGASAVSGGDYAVIFISQLNPGHEGYAQMAQQMVAQVSRQPGFLGLDSARGDDGLGVTVSYWESLEAIAAWRDEPAHLKAQRLGREQWYRHFTLYVARIEQGRSFSA